MRTYKWPQLGLPGRLLRKVATATLVVLFYPRNSCQPLRLKVHIRQGAVGMIGAVGMFLRKRRRPGLRKSEIETCWDAGSKSLGRPILSGAKSENNHLHSCSRT